MGFLNRLFGYRWSLYIATNENELRYVVHENSVLRILGYVTGSFARNGNPKPPWSLHLNFNHKHTAFELRRKHFTRDGTSPSPLLLDTLRGIDPKFDQIEGSEPVFLEALTKKRLKISNVPDFNSESFDFESYLDSIEERAKETTLFSVLAEVFGTKAEASARD